VVPKRKRSYGLLLANFAGEEQKSRVGNQSECRVIFLYTDDFERDYQSFLEDDIKIVRPRRKESFGEILVFEDLYGNMWDLIKSV